MKLKDRLNSDVCYFAFSLDPINADFDVATQANWGYARVFNPKFYFGFYGMYLLCGVYDFFTENLVSDIHVIQQNEFIMNQKLCLPPNVRGKNKWVYLGGEPIKSLKTPLDLPDMTPAAKNTAPQEEVTYYKNGIYTVFPGIGQKAYTAKFKNVSHLESTEIRSSANMVFELYIELLKNTGKQFKEQELLEKFINFGEGRDRWLGYSDIDKKFYFNSFKLRYQKIAYKSIPRHYRERAKEN